jgi:hypothetical protein
MDKRKGYYGVSVAQLHDKQSVVLAKFQDDAILGSYS